MRRLSIAASSIVSLDVAPSCMFLHKTRTSANGDVQHSHHPSCISSDCPDQDLFRFGIHCQGLVGFHHTCSPVDLAGSERGRGRYRRPAASADQSTAPGMASAWTWEPHDTRARRWHPVAPRAGPNSVLEASALAGRRYLGLLEQDHRLPQAVLLPRFLFRSHALWDRYNAEAN